MLTLKLIFWILLALVIYTYVGYGALLFVILKIKRLMGFRNTEPSLPSDEQLLPHVTLMICAYNEQDIIEEKMENIARLNYPQNKLTVMWVIDGSTDSSFEKLQNYPNVKVVFRPERLGKAAAIKHGLDHNDAEYVIFTDANTMLNADAIREVVRQFMKDNVSCVSGEKRVASRQYGQVASEGEGLYWKYESTLKRWDSELYSAMGAAGELFAIKMSDYHEAPSNALLDDFMISMLMVKDGHRIAYTHQAYAMEYGSADMNEESKRKRRIAAGGLQSIWWLRSLMNPFAHPKVAFQFISHRVLRWSLTPVAMMLLIPISIMLTAYRAGLIYDLLAAAQLAFYTAAFFGWWLAQKGRKHRLLYTPYYFLFMNLNVFKGIFYLIGHNKSGTWEKAKRG
ncbi:glycosyltransferase family 2 protein [Xylanibacter brevis]|uniref:glycosyltransferase family 2 protein n=1 Tax=Xylanibacter brevis TaxID=83231 RepID=UPI0004870E8A|nr:glycosyltransferase family 2 protein [Xylanibacter brevis]